MKRLLLAAILIASFAFSRAGARAEEDAYGSLIGMADSASGDKGPQAGDIPPDNAAMREARRAESPAYASGSAEPGTTASAPARAPKPAKAKREEAKEDEAPAVTVPPPAPRRAWTRMFSSLMPPPSRPSSFEVALSTAPRRYRAKTSPHPTAASEAGMAQGMLELVAAATAPYGAEVSLPRRR